LREKTVDYIARCAIEREKKQNLFAVQLALGECSHTKKIWERKGAVKQGRGWTTLVLLDILAILGSRGRLGKALKKATEGDT